MYSNRVHQFRVKHALAANRLGSLFILPVLAIVFIVNGKTPNLFQVLWAVAIFSIASVRFFIVSRIVKLNLHQDSPLRMEKVFAGVMFINGVLLGLSPTVFFQKGDPTGEMALYFLITLSLVTGLALNAWSSKLITRSFSLSALLLTIFQFSYYMEAPPLGAALGMVLFILFILKSTGSAEEQFCMHLSRRFENEELAFKLKQAIKAQRKHQREKESFLQKDHFASLVYLASGMAHEFNNPMTSIKASVRLVEKSITQKKEIKSDVVFPIIHNNIQRICDLINDLESLVSSKSEKENQKRCLFKTGVEYCLKNALPANSEVQLQLASNEPDYGLPLSVSTLDMALTPLLKNAFAAAAQGEEKWVKVFTKEEYPLLKVYIQDSGPRSKSPLTDQLFTPFTSNGPHKGTGLGLAMAKSTAMKHSGNIICLTSEYSNTTFCLELPLSKDEQRHGTAS